MTNVGNQPGYPYGTIPPEPRPASSWLWPALLGVGMVIAAGLVLLVALQLTDGGDDSIGTADTATSTSTTSTSTTTAPAPTTSTPTSSTVVGTTSPSAPTLAPTSALPTPAPTVAPPPTAPPEPNVTTAVPAGGSCAAYTPDGSIPVRRCSSGPLVAEIQSALRGMGFSIDADGFFGPGTEAAVLEFQASRGLEQDGIVGPDTYDALTG